MQAIVDNDIRLPTDKDLILTHLYIKCREKGVDITEPIREMLYYVYHLGGIQSKSDFDELVKLCSIHTKITNEASVRNTLSKCVGLKIVKNVGKYRKEISTDWLPEPNGKCIGLKYLIISQDAV